jgi:transmembrane 9 superfamily protein 2/4
MLSLTSVSLALAALTGVKAFYLPGVAPTTYHESDTVPVYVNTITPSLSQPDQQLRSVISYDCNIPPLTMTISNM